MKANGNIVHLKETETAELVCKKKESQARKEYNYSKLMYQATHKAADVQIIATCRAEKLTRDALYKCQVANNTVTL